MFFPLCWLFNYIWVGKACIYGALIEYEPVQLKCLQATVQSHKAVPLGLLLSSTRLLMTAVCLPWREGPSARPWHMPRNSNWGKVVCVKPATQTSFQWDAGGTWEKNHQADSRCHLWKSLGRIPCKPTCWWLKTCFQGCFDQLPELAVRVVSATRGCSLWSSGKRGGWNAKKVHGGTALGQTD